MKTIVLCLLSSVLCFSGCATAGSPGMPTPAQRTAAGITTDVISIGLAPVLANNPGYVPAAQALGVALGTLQGDTLTPANVTALVMSASVQVQGFSEKDQKTVAALINVAWARYAKNYQPTANAAIRPDVKLFIAAAAEGIAAAVAAQGGG